LHCLINFRILPLDHGYKDGPVSLTFHLVTISNSGSFFSLAVYYWV
jgi:hypothetical protein